jgi:hypothetical protein
MAMDGQVSLCAPMGEVLPPLHKATAGRRYARDNKYVMALFARLVYLEFYFPRKARISAA